MKTRVITGFLMAVILIPLFVLGGWVLNIVLTALTVVATYELAKLYNTSESLPKWIWILQTVFGGGLYLTVAGYFVGTIGLEWVFLLIIFTMLTGSFLLVFVDEFHSQRIGEMMFTVLYPALGFGAIYALREDSLLALGFVFLVTVATDIFAYIVGINFGKHRLAVSISPKKSIEGSIGGTVAAVVFVVLYVIGTDLEMIGVIELNIVVVILLTIFLSVIGQIGDLVASKLKRHMGIKDFSNIFPGHGGVMDRFDSVLLVALVLMMLDALVGLL